jgi:peroxiredoxin
MASLAPDLPSVTLLTDLGVVASKAWGLAVPDADVPEPATFVIDRGGAIRWRKLGDAKGDWPTYVQLTTGLDGK